MVEHDDLAETLSETPEQTMLGPFTTDPKDLFLFAKVFPELYVGIELYLPKKWEPSRLIARAEVHLMDHGWMVTGYGIMEQKDGRPMVIPPMIGGKTKFRLRAFQKIIRGDTTATPFVSLILETYREALALQQAGKTAKLLGKLVEPPQKL